MIIVIETPPWLRGWVNKKQAKLTGACYMDSTCNNRWGGRGMHWARVPDWSHQSGWVLKCYATSLFFLIPCTTSSYMIIEWEDYFVKSVFRLLQHTFRHLSHVTSRLGWIWGNSTHFSWQTSAQTVNITLQKLTDLYVMGLGSPFILKLSEPHFVSIKQRVGHDSDINECQPLLRAAICAGIWLTNDRFPGGVHQLHWKHINTLRLRVKLGTNLSVEFIPSL